MVPSKSKASASRPNAFPPRLRVRKREDFARLRKNSRKWVARHWILYYSPNEMGHPRIAFSISSRYGNSVERNRIRRWLREAFRLNQATLPALDLHFIPRQKPAKLDKKRYIEELHEDFEKLVHRLR